MNTLTYGLLAILSNQSLSGYDLMLKLNAFWHTTHSRIYPLLAKLEQEKYVTYTLIEQTGKPDKKTYSITEKGLKAVMEWVLLPTDAMVKKDKLLLKIYCIHLLDKDSIEKLLKEREEILFKKINEYNKRIEAIKTQCNSKMDSVKSPYFSSYILLQKILSEATMEIKWCRWVMSIFNNEGNINFLDISFSNEVFTRE